MLFKILVVLHVLGATVWAGSHLLAVTVLPQALKHCDPDRIHQKEGAHSAPFFFRFREALLAFLDILQE